MLIRSPKATCLVVGLCFHCPEPVSEAQPPNCYCFQTHFWFLAHTSSPHLFTRGGWKGAI